MKLETLKLDGLRQIEGYQSLFSELKQRIEQQFNLAEYSEYARPIVFNWSPIMRACLLVGLSDNSMRDTRVASTLQIAKNTEPFPGTFFNKQQLKETIIALMKLRYHDVDGDWDSSVFVSKVLTQEMLHGRDILMNGDNLEKWLRFETKLLSGSVVDIPEIKLEIGKYESGTPAIIDINSKKVTNTQIIIAGTTGSGKSNLLAVLLHQLRSSSVDSRFPVNFLLFDYKGEFSDPKNEPWLQLFETDKSAILDPMIRPLPFTPFKSFVGEPENKLNTYATTLASALTSIDNANIGAIMSNRLADAVVNAYKENHLAPITFQILLDSYQKLMPSNRQDNEDSISSVLKQLTRYKIFSDTDHVDLIRNSYIINLGQFPKDGALSKAIVYFVVSKLNNIYEQLPPQAQNDNRVELRHFTVIDEAHYMLGFDNSPLRQLIAVGRNKGMSIILATQSMTQYNTRYFDFYQNAQFPLVMKQQQQNDAVLKGIFGVTGQQLNELKQAITNLQKGELIIKDETASTLGLGVGRNWKKISVTHLI